MAIENGSSCPEKHFRRSASNGCLAVEKANMENCRPPHVLGVVDVECLNVLREERLFEPHGFYLKKSSRRSPTFK